MVKLSVIEEVKVPEKKRSQDKGEPIQLGRQPPIVLILSEEATLLRNAMRGLLGFGKIYAFNISSILNASSSGAGIINALINTSTISSNTDLIALSAVFQEAFIVSMAVHVQPVSRYQYPLTGVTATSVANVPMGYGLIQHNTPAYTSLAGLSQNYGFRLVSTGDPFSVTWYNAENPASGVSVSTTTPAQGWVQAIDMSIYTGNIQFLTQSAPPALPFSEVIFVAHVKYHVLFRCRE